MNATGTYNGGGVGGIECYAGDHLYQVDCFIDKNGWELKNPQIDGQPCEWAAARHWPEDVLDAIRHEAETMTIEE